ncbi:hypothetical protein Zmor_009671 [Zophobas morio]|uniref:Uncharacterized protein n=1 Tax=Zophobas morio TaxID=2755281 RepID=A0AA38ILS1_9CUCU|nr:hypothetical protein Zmor_009671 [Zophobas morio]
MHTHRQPGGMQRLGNDALTFLDGASPRRRRSVQNKPKVQYQLGASGWKSLKLTLTSPVFSTFGGLWRLCVPTYENTTSSRAGKHNDASLRRRKHDWRPDTKGGILRQRRRTKRGGRARGAALWA